MSVQKIFKFTKGSCAHWKNMVIFEFENIGCHHLGFLNTQNFTHR